MGWSYGVNSEGREVGYSVPANCDKPGCYVIIDRGLAYVCGGMHNADWNVGCGKYFCTEHLFLTGIEDVPKEISGPCVFLCGPCADEWEAAAKLTCLDCGDLGKHHDRRADPHKRDDPQPPCNVPDCTCEGWEPPEAP